MSTPGTYLKPCEREQLARWLQRARERAPARRAELRAAELARWESFVEASPRRVVVDVRHEPGLDVLPSTMGNTRDLPAGEFRGSPVVPLWQLDNPVRVCVVQEELGAVLLHSFPYRDDVDGVVDRFGRHVVQSVHETRGVRVTKREVVEGGHRSLVVRCPMPRHYNLTKLHQTLKAWAIGDAAALAALHTTVRPD